MFARRFFPGSYFAPRYFPPVPGDVQFIFGVIRIFPSEVRDKIYVVDE